ncbi:MAG: class I tRNA ligase family protein, partial [Clostridia bacterium]|nr:class I tRNA ligase family protein [Clostridia bacterium]
TMPHITEEIYQDYFRQFDGNDSIHLSVLSPIDLGDAKDVRTEGDTVVELVALVRAHKSENKLSLKTVFDKATISAPAEVLKFLENVDYDLKAVSSIRELEFVSGETGIEFGNIVE